MRITATFGPSLLACAVPARRPVPAPQHAIVNDIPAIEAARVALFQASLRLARERGTMPEHDAEAEAFYREHGLVAAIIRDPVGEAYLFAASILRQRMEALLTPEEHLAANQRLSAILPVATRYAADTRSRH